MQLIILPLGFKHNNGYKGALSSVYISLMIKILLPIFVVLISGLFLIGVFFTEKKKTRDILISCSAAVNIVAILVCIIHLISRITILIGSTLFMLISLVLIVTISDKKEKSCI